jgi:hypothetical protein
MNQFRLTNKGEKTAEEGVPGEGPRGLDEDREVAVLRHHPELF